MEITVAGRKMPVTNALREYAEEKIGNSMKVMEITLFTKGHIVRVEEHEEDMYAAIDVAAAKVLRQLRKFKTRVLDRKNAHAETIREMPVTGVGLDELMEELSAEDEIVRVKEVEFAPKTEEEALVEIDLLGHDFYVYTDRDTNEVQVLYRRKNGGYGLLKPKRAE